MDIEFSISKYIWSHGHAPRGYGWWYFTFEGMDFSFTGTYSEAKKACKKHIHEIAPHGYKGLVIVNVET